jgi:lipopolysaccharide transport system permease protein
MSELWYHRRWIWEAAVSDLRHRYAGSALGMFWNIVMPITMLAVYVLIFTRLLGPRSAANGVSSSFFVLYLSCGFLPWITFTDGLVRSAQSFLTNAVYLKKLAIPEVVFVAQTTVSATLSMFIAVALLPILVLVMGQPASWSWLLLPVIVVIWQTFGFGLGLALSAINVFFRDVAQILTVLLQVWMWSIPIVYFEDFMPAAYRPIFQLNPAYPFVTALRDTMLAADPPRWLWAAMAGWTLLALLVGGAILRGLRAELRDLL